MIKISNIRKIWKRLFCLVLSVAMLVSCSDAEKGSQNANETFDKTVSKNGSFTYNDCVAQLCTNWNPHTYMTADDSYPLGFISSSLYSFVFNDKLHPVKGKQPYESYDIVPEMAEGQPIDVTTSVRATHPQFNIPSSAQNGFAYRIKLREDICWEDGTPITADTFIESLKRLLDPKLLNYRATDVYEGTYSIANAQNYANAGKGTFTSFANMGTTYEEYIKGGGKDEDVYVDLTGFWNITTADNKSYGAITDDTMIRDEAVEEGKKEDYVSPKYLWETYLKEGKVDSPDNYVGVVDNSTPADYSFENVGLYKEDDYSLVFVFNNALEGYYLVAALNTSWLVKPDLYDACLKETKTASGSVWSSTYGTSKATTVSYGPYKLDSYQRDKSICFVRNNQWFGYGDGNHVYVDPVDKKRYDMYQTTKIHCQVIADSTTQKQMFFSGKFSEYALKAEDFDQYRNSEFCHISPAGSTYYIVLNGFKEVIEKREQSPDFNQKKKDIQTLTLDSFRQAMAVSFDKSDFVRTIFPNSSEGYGLFGKTYIYDPDRCDFYRDTKEAKKTLCDYYGVDPGEYSSLDTAEGSITGYDSMKGAELFEQAYKEALKKGYVTDRNHDGKSDQTVTLTYTVSADNDNVTKIVEYLNDCLRDITHETGFENRVKIVKSAPLGNEWVSHFRNGLTDIVIGGWTGMQMDPFSMCSVFTDKNRAYDGNWFDAKKTDMTVKIKGEDITMPLADWANVLTGQTVTVEGKDYNFGYSYASEKQRLKILAAFEKAILSTYDYIPMADMGSMSLLSQKHYYVTDQYNPVMGYGDISYIRYNYNDKEWKAFVRANNGTLQY